jgi:hypothetical protein
LLITCAGRWGSHNHSGRGSCARDETEMVNLKLLVRAVTSLGLRGGCIGDDDLVLQSREIEEVVASTTQRQFKSYPKASSATLEPFYRGGDLPQLR